MKEVEVKARLRDPVQVVHALKKLGCTFTPPVRQDDVVFMHNREDPERAFGGGKKGLNVLRIRTQAGKALFTLKQNQGNELDCTEHETEIANPEELRRAIELLGFREVVRVGKLRQKTGYSAYEICVDQVDGLGNFIEVEKLVEDGDGEAIQEELFRFLERLGVARSDRELRGYDTLTWRAKSGKAEPKA